jgi:lipopolysaccharide export system protein LptA
MFMKWQMVMACVVGLMMATGVELAAQEAAPAAGEEANSTEISSKRLDFDYSKHTAVFDGDVVVTDPRVRIMADQITALFNTNNQPDMITAVGNVRIDQENRRAVCDRATYSLRTGLLVLTGKPKVIQEGNILSGSRIIFSRDDDKVKCEDSKLTIVPGPGGGFDDLMKIKR